MTDGYLANAAEPWRLPNIDEIPRIEINVPGARAAGQDVSSFIFNRNPETLGRPWVAPGMPGLMYRVGGIEKDLRTGNISYEAQNHQAMTDLRAAKVASVAKFIPPQKVELGPEQGLARGRRLGLDVRRAVSGRARVARARSASSHIHIRYLSPFPENLGELLRGFDRILVPEMNMGQLATLLRDKLGVETIQFNKVTGQPFLIGELVQKIRSLLGAKPAVRAVRGERA